MIEVFLPPPFVVEVFNANEAVRISLAIFTSVVLVFIDTMLRVLVEARNFNLATNREVLSVVIPLIVHSLNIA